MARTACAFHALLDLGMTNNVDITGQIKRIDTIYLGGGLNGTSNVTSACYQIESAYALASCRTSVSRGSQYGGTSYYILFANFCYEIG